MSPLCVLFLWFLKFVLASFLNLRHPLRIYWLKAGLVDDKFVAILSSWVYSTFRGVFFNRFCYFLDFLLFWRFLFLLISDFYFFFYLDLLPLLIISVFFLLINFLVFSWTLECYSGFGCLISNWCFHCFSDTGSFVKWSALLWSFSSEDEFLVSTAAYISCIFSLLWRWVLFDDFRDLRSLAILRPMPHFFFRLRCLFWFCDFFVVRDLDLLVLWAESVVFLH